MSDAAGSAVLEYRAAELVTIAGLDVPAHFGDPQREVRAARGGIALAPRPWRALVRVSGERRVKFLQGMISNDMEALVEGDGCRALFLDNKGHVLGDLEIWAAADALVMATDFRVVDDVVAGLSKYVLGAPVTFEDRRGEELALGLLGPRYAEVLEAAGAAAPPPGRRTRGTGRIAGVDVDIARSVMLGAPGVELHVPVARAGAVREALEAAAAEVSEDEPASLLLGWQAAEVLRIESGQPAHGAELTGDQFPQEARLDEAVDYEKGCYLGQETVARIHYRGQVNRLLAGLRAAAPVPVGAELRAGDRAVGSVTSAAVSPDGGAVGLGYVKREQATDGTTLEAAGADGEAVAVTVVDLRPDSAEATPAGD